MLYTTSMLKIRQNRDRDIDANQGQGGKVHIGARAVLVVLKDLKKFNF